MAAPTVTVRGKAAVEGVVGTFTVILYPLQQSLKVSHDFEEETVKDAHGFDAAWLARNEKYHLDIGMKLVGDTVAHAKAGAAFSTPYTKITISGADVAVLNGDWHIVSGADIDLGNTKVGDINFKLRQYTNTDQNTAATTTPT